MQWNEIIKKRLKLFVFLGLLLSGTAFLVITDNDEGPSLWERWFGRRSVHASSPVLLKQVATIDVPGPKGKRFDYLTLDPSRHLLFSTHLGAGLPTESKPDGIAYAPPFHKIYVSDERAKGEAVVDVTKDEVVTTLHFESETGNPRYDPVSKRVYVNLQDKNVIAEIDPATDKEVAEYPVGKCKGNHGMALDGEHRLAFLSCEDNNLMTVFRLDTHQPIAYLQQAGGGDVIAFDPGLKRIYVACYDGAISVFQEDDPAHFRKLGDVPVQKKVHSLAIDPETHRVYAPEQEENGAPAAKIAVFEAVP
jgi:DNA-binding beta-propeller fold protein YncE